MKPAKALVITSISPPNKVLASFAKGCKENNVSFYLIGDKASPPDFRLANCDFFSLEDQRKMEYRLSGSLPEKHYSRKNLGYLLAIKNGAEIILESDDDNFPEEAFWKKREQSLKAHKLTDLSWVNVYAFFGDEGLWPRGFPLEEINSAAASLNESQVKLVDSPIQQGLADMNPDVDAVFRMTRKLPVNFVRREVPVAVSKGSWCPFNSQNTTWFKPAFPLLYLPSYCSFRMTDIWRSFVALRICWENDWDVLFHSPTVWQERNAHNLLRDFADEISGYLNNKSICGKLAELQLEKGAAAIFENMVKCYRVFIEMGLMDKRELALLEDWSDDLEKVQGIQIRSAANKTNH